MLNSTTLGTMQVRGSIWVHWPHGTAVFTLRAYGQMGRGKEKPVQFSASHGVVLAKLQGRYSQAAVLDADEFRAWIETLPVLYRDSEGEQKESSGVLLPVAAHMTILDAIFNKENAHD